MDKPKIPIAPNGITSNLSPEDWLYVRSSEFKAWAGDWEDGKSNVILDENGEPLALYHGSTKDFERFDMSKGGENTGLTEYTDKKTGEKVVSDSNKCMFFTDSFHQAVSYAFLNHYNEVADVAAKAGKVEASIRKAALSSWDYRSKDAFLQDVEFLKPYCPVLRELPDRISPLSEEERLRFTAPLKELYGKYKAAADMMENGKLSNMCYNAFRQRNAVRDLRENLARLRRNDLDVPNEFGTFNDYMMSVCGASGNAEVCLYTDRDNNRIIFHDYSLGPEGRRYFDEMTDREAAAAMDLLDRKCDEQDARFRKAVTDGGYNEKARIYRVFLKATNPLKHDYQGSAFPDVYRLNEKYPTAYVAARQVAAAERRGCDAVVYQNIRDPFDADTYGVFSPDQILIREKQYGVLNVPALREADAQRLRQFGACEDEILALRTDGEAVIEAPFEFPLQPGEQGFHKRMEDPMRLTLKEDGVTVSFGRVKDASLGQLLHEARKDRDYLHSQSGAVSERRGQAPLKKNNVEQFRHL